FRGAAEESASSSCCSFQRGIRFSPHPPCHLPLHHRRIIRIRPRPSRPLKPKPLVKPHRPLVARCNHQLHNRHSATCCPRHYRLDQPPPHTAPARLRRGPHRNQLRLPVLLEQRP